MLGKVIDYLIMAPLMALGAITLAMQWMLAPGVVPGLIVGGLLMAWMLVMTYQTGYKKYHRPGRRLFFYVVFLTPTILAIVTYAGGMAWKFM